MNDMGKEGAENAHHLVLMAPNIVRCKIAV